MVSHELRTPLSLIIGLSEMMLQEQHEQPGLSSTSLRDLTQVNTSAQHLARLIGDVLDLASSEAGQLRILHEPLDLSEIAQMAAKIGEQLAREKSLTWSAELPHQGPWVQGDRTRLGQVIINLISNAVKFTPQGKVRLELAVAGQQVTVSVSDTGIGISPTEQKSIFQEFHRSERTIRSGYSGLGLGLAISRQLVERHNGKIGVRSPGDLGSGSTFFFTLPVLSTSKPQADLAAALTSSNNTVMVLTGSDDPCEELCGYLVQRGFDVRSICVEDGGKWLSEVAASQPAALILGPGLAERQGWTILGMLKRHATMAQLPVLVYSLDITQDRGELLELNYLQKPLQLEQLAEQLERYCDVAGEERCVLVVDDDPAILDLHSRLVKKVNCRALTARNGREALNILENTHPDLILLDLMMPEMDGFEVLDALRQREATRDIPVIVLTARVLSDADLERCNQSVTTILGKGLFSAAETLSHIESALARQRTLGRATQQLVRQAMAYIHTHYSEPLSRKDIACHIGISADYLTDCFRKEMNVTPMTYLRRYRIRQACELLENTNLTITQVAGAVGYSESAHFTHNFQQEIGVTPRAYRNGKRKRSLIQ
jgi:DNA-binding response OmpR family regulator